MASPFRAIGKFLFGGGSQTPQQTLVTNPPPSQPTPSMTPTGTSSSNKPAQGASFLSSAAPVATQQQTAAKSLLGQ